MLVGVAMAMGLGSCEGGVVRIEGSAGRGEGRGNGAVLDTEHVLVGSHRAGDLDELNEEQHANPGKL